MGISVVVCITSFAVTITGAVLIWTSTIFILFSHLYNSISYERTGGVSPRRSGTRSLRPAPAITEVITFIDIIVKTLIVVKENPKNSSIYETAPIPFGTKLP